MYNAASITSRHKITLFRTQASKNGLTLLEQGLGDVTARERRLHQELRQSVGLNKEQTEFTFEPPMLLFAHFHGHDEQRPLG